MIILRIYNTETGDFIRDDFTYDSETESAYEGNIPQGLYQPWFVRSLDGTGAWLEGLTPTQIHAIKDNSIPTEPSIKEKVKVNSSRIATIEQIIDVLYGGV